MSGEDLIRASRNGDITEVEKLIDQGAPVNSEERSSAGAPAQLVRYQDEQGNTALMIAAMRMKPEIISALLWAGADVNLQNDQGATALMFVASCEHPGIIRELVEAGANVNLQDIRGRTALMDAALYGNLETVRVLLRAGAYIDTEDKDGKMAWTYASKDDVKNLIAEYSNVPENIGGPTNETLGKDLIQASKDRDIEKIRGLIDQGVPINYQDKDGKTALIWAVLRDELGVVRELIKAGANVNVRDSLKYTALMWAAITGNPEVIRILIESGSDINNKSVWGTTSLMLAASDGNLRALRELIKAKADLNLQSASGLTALMFAAKNGKLDEVRELLKAGASLEYSDSKGQTAYDLSKDDKIKKLIIHYPNIRQNIGKLRTLRYPKLISPITQLTYLSIIPSDLIFLIEIELSDENSY